MILCHCPLLDTYQRASDHHTFFAYGYCMLNSKTRNYFLYSTSPMLHCRQTRSGRCICSYHTVVGTEFTTEVGYHGPLLPSQRHARVVNVGASTRSRVSIHLAIRRLTARSREVSKPPYSVLDFSNRSEIRQEPRQQRCRDSCQSSEL